MGRNKCTVAGLEAARREYALLQKELCCKSLRDDSRNSVRESEMTEFHNVMDERGIKHSRQAVLATFMCDHEPFTQTKTDRVRVGNLVTCVYDDDTGLEMTKQFVLGGENEPAIFAKQKIAILSYRGAFGNSFVGKKAGDSVSVKLDGREREVEITAIDLAPEPDAIGDSQVNLSLVANAA